MKRFCTVLLTALLVCFTAAGCGGGREKGKNQDVDRPKAPVGASPTVR